jgi:hypothetical protein
VSSALVGLALVIGLQTLEPRSVNEERYKIYIASTKINPIYHPIPTSILYVPISIQRFLDMSDNPASIVKAEPVILPIHNQRCQKGIVPFLANITNASAQSPISVASFKGANCFCASIISSPYLRPPEISNTQIQVNIPTGAIQATLH